MRGQPRIAIIGAGLAGLACAERLTRQGLTARVFEAHPTRLGGRCYSDRVTFPGQVCENGGEMIDTPHKTMLGYAQAFGLLKEDLEHAPGATAFHFFGAMHSEDAVIAEYRELVGRMRPDLQSLSSGGPTFFSHTAADVVLDNTDLQTYLDTRAGDLPLANAMLSQAYVAEYGREPSDQSTLNFLLLIHLDKRRHLAEFGQFSDERYHLIGGNDQIIHALADHVTSRGCSITQNAQVGAITRNASGEYSLTIGGSTIGPFDTVVTTVPFSVMRGFSGLDAPSLGLSADKLRAIRGLGYGDNVKTAVHFDRRVWADQGFNGLAYADLANVQNTWETNYTSAVPGGGGILTDYAGGDRGAKLQANPPQTSGCGVCHNGATTNSAMNDVGFRYINDQMEAFVADLDRIYPGAATAVTRRADPRWASPGPLPIVGQRAHWTRQRYSRGSYTSYLPGQFCGIAGLEGQAAGALKFAGEHTDSFYDWQGFMEGGCNSGIRAAEEILGDIKTGRL